VLSQKWTSGRFNQVAETLRNVRELGKADPLTGFSPANCAARRDGAPSVGAQHAAPQPGNQSSADFAREFSFSRSRELFSKQESRYLFGDSFRPFLHHVAILFSGVEGDPHGEGAITNTTYHLL
jgi:hypothetical protein